MTATPKSCAKCGQSKVSRKNKTVCIPCRSLRQRTYYRNVIVHQAEKRRVWNEQRRLRQYGLSEAALADLTEVQGGKCAVCGLVPTGEKMNGILQIDHDHTSGRVRGLLCHCCNSGIGKFRDNAETMEKAAAYIRASKAIP